MQTRVASARMRNVGRHAREVLATYHLITSYLPYPDSHRTVSRMHMHTHTKHNSRQTPPLPPPNAALASPRRFISHARSIVSSRLSFVRPVDPQASGQQISFPR